MLTGDWSAVARKLSINEWWMAANGVNSWAPQTQWCTYHPDHWYWLHPDQPTGWINVGWMTAQRLRRWAVIHPASGSFDPLAPWLTFADDGNLERPIWGDMASLAGYDPRPLRQYDIYVRTRAGVTATWNPPSLLHFWVLTHVSPRRGAKAHVISHCFKWMSMHRCECKTNFSFHLSF